MQKVDVDLGSLPFSEGGHLLIKRALRSAGAGNSIPSSAVRLISKSTCVPGVATRAMI